MERPSVPLAPSTSSKVVEYSSRHPNVDALFLERLETFMDRSLADIKAFADRELRPFEETRRCVAEWHAKHLFQASSSPESSYASRHDYVRSLLMQSSRVLESLAETAGVQSFFLAVDMRDEADSGFLGGSVYGREFWRTLRGGGEHGARAFKQYCRKNETDSTNADDDLLADLVPSSNVKPAPSSTVKQDAKTVKMELYETVRRALKAASGVRNAEMKWTNPERLDSYGVRLVGWPDGIPANNPSTLRVNQNRQLLEAFKSGTARFERLPTSIHPAPSIPQPELDKASDSDDFSWAFDPDASHQISLPAPATSISKNTESQFSSPKQAPTSSVASTSRGNTPLSQTGSSLEPWDAYGPSASLVDSDDIWDAVGRPRKRMRSASPDLDDPGRRDLDV